MRIQIPLWVVWCSLVIIVAMFQLPLNAEEIEVTEKKIGVTEKKGNVIPLDSVFLDSDGKRFLLSDYIDKPTFILPIYCHCPHICGMQTAYLAKAISTMSEVPGEDFQVLSISFDDEETPQDAKTMKENYLPLTNKESPHEYWKFLTGDQTNIRRVTDAAGYYFKKVETHKFQHPAALFMVAEDGTVTRYLYGPEFKPFDLSMAIAETKRGLLGVSVKKALSYCFEYDPEKKRYVFRVFRVVGFLTIIALISFYFFFLRKKRR